MLEQLGRLATLGIIQGKPFNPDERMKRILDQGAKQGAAMSRAIVYASRDPDIRYWPERHWEKMFLHNTTFERDGVADIDARTLWHYHRHRGFSCPDLYHAGCRYGIFGMLFVIIKARILMVVRTYKLRVRPSRQSKISGR